MGETEENRRDNDEKQRRDIKTIIQN